MCILSEEESRRAGNRCEGASRNASWTLSCARMELDERGEDAGTEAVRVGREGETRCEWKDAFCGEKIYHV